MAKDKKNEAGFIFSEPGLEQNGFTGAHRLQWIVTGVLLLYSGSTGPVATPGLGPVTIHCSRCASVNPFCSRDLKLPSSQRRPKIFKITSSTPDSSQHSSILIPIPPIFKSDNYRQVTQQETLIQFRFHGLFECKFPDPAYFGFLDSDFPKKTRLFSEITYHFFSEKSGPYSSTGRISQWPKQNSAIIRRISLIQCEYDRYIHSLTDLSLTDTGICHIECESVCISIMAETCISQTQIGQTHTV